MQEGRQQQEPTEATQERLNAAPERRRNPSLQAGEDVKVLTVVYLPGDTLRIISFRPANRREREKYHEWLEIDGEVE